MLRVVLGPLVCAGITAAVISAFSVTTVTLATFAILYLIWLVLINGGILILDDLDF